MPHTSVVSNSVWPLRWQPTRLLCPRILQARTLEWVSISFSNAWKWKVKGMSLSPVHLFGTARTAAYQTPPSMWFSRQEYWSAVSSTSYIYIYIYAAKSLQSCPTLCDPVDGSPAGLPRPWDSPGKNTGEGCLFLLQCKKVTMKVKSLSRVRPLATLWTAAYQAPRPMEFSREEYWSGVPLASPI